MRSGPSRALVVLLTLALVATLWASGGGTAAQEVQPEPETSAPSLKPYGPTNKAPRGGRPDPRGPWSNRWRYRGTLGRLGNNEQVVPPVTSPPARVRNQAPLTGRPARNLDRRALVIKIDNVPRARPQTNLNAADIVYEELVEGGFTRFAAVFHSKRVTSVGPVRSARSTDIGIAVSFRQPIFAFSGANNIFDRLISRARLVDRNAERYLRLYWRGGGRPAPHNLFTSSSRLLGSAPAGNPPPPHFEYRDRREPVPPDAGVARIVRLRFQRGRGLPIRYEWSDRAGGWLRWQNGSPHRDSAGVQVAPQNLIVQIVRYADTGMTDKWGEILYEAQMVGTGRALVFTDGHVIEATWTKPTLRSVTTYTDAEGNHIELTRGRTWVALVPPGGVTFDGPTCGGRLATIAGTSGDDNLRGTDERDIIAAFGGDDLVAGRDGRDLICGGDGNDRISGGPGNDLLKGGGGHDDLRGDAGADRLSGGGGHDQLHGGRGADRLNGGRGTDQLYGDESVDRFRGSGDIRLRGP